MKHLIILLLFFMNSFFYSQDVDGDTVLKLVNEYRSNKQKCGSKKMKPVSELEWSKDLCEVAQYHSDWMCQKKKLSHKGSKRSDLVERLNRFNIDYLICGENIAQVYGGVEQVIKVWMESPGHCVNIMNKDFKEIGVSEKGGYWTMLLIKSN